MQKSATAASFLALLLLAGQASAVTPDFRSARWGMSQVQVSATEPGKPVYKDRASLQYAAKLAGLPMVAIYGFVRARLQQGRYVPVERSRESAKYVDDYKQIRATLAKRYEAPRSDSVDWSNDMYRANTRQWGKALELGHVRMQTQWLTGRTRITLSLSGKSHRVTLSVLYENRNPGFEAGYGVARPALEGR